VVDGTEIQRIIQGGESANGHADAPAPAGSPA
jgi:hypothetical protein